jgi:SAM-dependent methyltransferase
MTYEVRTFVAQVLEDIDHVGRVLEVGSKNVGPGTIRDQFIGKDVSEYVGIDISEGDGVDLVLDGHDIQKEFPKSSFDMVICCETFEHDSAFWLTLENMKYVLKPGGWLIITAPGPHCPKHDWPHDYWRFMGDSFALFFDGFEQVRINWSAVGGRGGTDHDEQTYPDAWYGAGRKPLP